MKGMFLTLCGVCTGLLTCVAEAVVPASEVYPRLRQGLEQEVALLSSVKNAATAQSTLSALREHHARLTAMKSECPRAELWRYIDNTPHLKGALIELVQKIALEYQRLEKASFFSCDELRTLLAPQLTPAASRSKGE